MSLEHNIRRRGNEILLGIGFESAALDILTNESQLRECIRILEQPHQGLVYSTIGKFGIYPITLNVHFDDTASLSIDGPDFEPARNETVGFGVDKQELLKMLLEIVE